MEMSYTWLGVVQNAMPYSESPTCVFKVGILLVVNDASVILSKERKMGVDKMLAEQL